MKKETLLDLEDTNIFSSSTGMYFRMQIIIMATLCVPLSPKRSVKNRSKRLRPTNNHLRAFSESKRTFPKARSSSGTQRKPLEGLEKTSASISPAVLKPSAMKSETVTGKSTKRDFPLSPRCPLSLCVRTHTQSFPQETEARAGYREIHKTICSIQFMFDHFYNYFSYLYFLWDAGNQTQEFLHARN